MTYEHQRNALVIQPNLIDPRSAVRRLRLHIYYDPLRSLTSTWHTLR